MAIPTFKEAREWFEKNALKFSSREERIASYCEHFELKEPQVLTQSGSISNWAEVGRMLGSLQQGLGMTSRSAPARMKSDYPKGAMRNSKVRALKELFQPATNDNSSVNFEELVKKACAILFPAKVLRANNREAKKLERIQQQLKNLSPEAKAKLLAQLDPQAPS